MSQKALFSRHMSDDFNTEHSAPDLENQGALSSTGSNASNTPSNASGSIPDTQSSVSSLQGSNSSTQGNMPVGGQAQYMNQEEAYVHRLKSSMVHDDYYGRDPKLTGKAYDPDESDADSDDEFSDKQDIYLARVKRANLALTLDPSNVKDPEVIKERTEWQIMLTSVLTGDIFMSEKSRLTRALNVDEVQKWTELKAKVTCRSVIEQRREISVGRSMTHEILDQIMNFQLKGSFESIEEPFEEVGLLLDLLDRCESQWPNVKAMKEYFSLYASPECEARVDALTSWYTVTQSILQELELLQKWTGNLDADPTRSKETSPSGSRLGSLVEASVNNSNQNENQNQSPNLSPLGTPTQTPTQSVTNFSDMPSTSTTTNNNATRLNYRSVYRRTSVVDFSVKQDYELPEIIIANDNNISLVNSIVKHEDGLWSIFRNHIERCIFPLIERARECTIKYSSMFVEMGLPLFMMGLSPVIAFPVKLVKEVIEMKLRAVAIMNNPTMPMIDEAISKLRSFIILGRSLTKEYNKTIEPVLNKGWVFMNRENTSINEILLRCIRFYLDLLSNKFIDGGRSSTSFFRSFKSIDELPSHFKFLHRNCDFIDGGDISVAEQFSTLYSRVFSRLLAYWEHQMEGPANWNKLEMDRWFASTIENTRSIQRKLLRFYKNLCRAYQNSSEYRMTVAQTREFLDYLKEHDYFLVFAGNLERFGSYTFASKNLRDKPLVIRNLIQGHSPPPDDNEFPGAIVLLLLTEAFQWDGEIFKMDIGSDKLPEFDGQLRLVVQGGHRELMLLRQSGPLAKSHLTVPRRSHLENVEIELNKVKTIIYRLAMTVESSALEFKSRVRSLECQETVQTMFFFAREFGQRSLQFVSETRRRRIVSKLFELCVEWVEFVADDCPPSENKTFKWTVQALEFSRVMMGGVNILVVPEEQFIKLRRKVADCVTLLISHFDIMGARSKAADLTDYRGRLLLNANSRMNAFSSSANSALKDDDAVIAAHRGTTLEKLDQINKRLSAKSGGGKILDQNNTEFEFLSFASSPFTAAAMRWQRAEPIGSGASGVVFKANSLDDFHVMAVKEVRISTTQSISRVLKNIKDEMTVLEMVSHPNIVQYYGVEVHRERVFIFMEYCPGGSLAEMLQYGRIDDHSIVQFFSLQMFEGLAYLHQSGIVHRDIKPENILLNNNFIKIVDFGAAKIIANRGNASMQTYGIDAIKGTPMYMAPEVIKGKRSRNLSSVDIWSMGCVILQMVTGQTPWIDCDNVFSIMYCIGNNRRPELPGPNTVDAGCRSILERTLQYEPSQRPSAMTLLRDSWFDEARETLKQFLEMREQDHEFVNEHDRDYSPTDISYEDDDEGSDYLNHSFVSPGANVSTHQGTNSNLLDRAKLNQENRGIKGKSESLTGSKMDTIVESEIN